MTLEQKQYKPPSRLLRIADVLQLHTFIEHHGSCFDFSPDGRKLAFCKQGPMVESQRYTDAFWGGIARGELYVLDLTSRALIQVAQQFECFTPAWSPCGQYIAFGAATPSAAKLAFVRPDGSDMHVADIDNLDFSGMRAFSWIDSENLVCVVPPDGLGPHLFDVERRGLRKAVAAWNVLEHTPLPTASAWETTGRPVSPKNFFISNWKREVVIYDRCRQQSAPASSDSTDPVVLAFISKVSNGHSARLDGRELSSRYDMPCGELVAVHEASDQALFLVQDGSGSSLVLCGAPWPIPTPVFRTNAHLEGVAIGQCVDLETAGPAPKRVRVLLPPGARSGHALPAVMYVYPGAGPGKKARSFYRLHEASQFNFQLLAAQGYAVIEPTIELPDDRRGVDVPKMVAQATKAAAEACVNAGLVDPNRLHVMGHSRGGWAAASLLTTTDLFRSGIALAGAYNAFSLHGACDPRFRYEDVQNELDTPFMTDICEEWFGMSGPPGNQLQRYADCSPVLGTSRLRAPLMLVHSDQDFFPMAQAEEMYAAVRRVGKRATLVRYWGEGHILAKPENIADLWTRIFTWLGDVEGGQPG